MDAQKTEGTGKKSLNESENSIVAIFRMLEMNRDIFSEYESCFSG